MHCKNSGGWSKGGDNKPYQLYNLREDLREQTNLIDEDPKRAKAMQQALMDVIVRGALDAGADAEQRCAGQAVGNRQQARTRIGVRSFAFA